MGKKSSSEFRDIRLDKTRQDLLESMTIRYSSVLRQLATTNNEESRFTNFINNKKVNPDAILSQSWKETKADWSDKHMLVVSDSSTLSFVNRADREKLGYIGQKTKKTGFHIHPSILLDAKDGGLYGVGSVNIIKTDFAQTPQEIADKKQRNKDRWKIPFEKKERYKWLTSPKKAIENCPTAAQYTLVGDRETDIYDLMSRTLNEGWDFLYRSKNNRKLSNTEEFDTLYKTLPRWNIEHKCRFDVAASKKRSKHEVTANLKYGTVSIKRPKFHRDKELPENIELQVVEIKECTNSVVGNEAPIHWILLTSHPVNTVEQALQILQWYRWRWTIEELFRTLKTRGLNIEASEVETFHGLANLTTMALSAAAQTMQMVKARDGQTNQKIEDVFTEKEQECLKQLNKQLQGNTEKSKNPHPSNSLAYASWIIGRLGGWKGYVKSRPPGPITMIKGLTKFYNILNGYYLII